MAEQGQGAKSPGQNPISRVRRLDGVSEALSLLEIDRLYAAYPIAESEVGRFEKFDWFAAEEEDDVTVCQQYAGSQPNRLFIMGSEGGAAIVLGSVLRLPYVNFTCEQRHVSVIQAHYRIGEPETMVRMAATMSRFRPVEGDVVPLAPNHLEEIKVLYRVGGMDIVTPDQLSTGVYRGVRLSGQLVSVAGTHVISNTNSIAAVGNVFTHPDHRNRGYATACTSAVAAELLRKCRDVVLNVAASNGPAIRVYAKLGFREHCRFIQLVGVRKGTAHLSSFVDRLKNR